METIRRREQPGRREGRIDIVSKSELMKSLKEEYQTKQFSPYSHLDESADTLTVYFEGDADYSERLSDHVTLYRALDTNDVIGCRIKGVSGIIEDLPNYVEVNHGGTKISMIFLAFRGVAEDAQVSETINQLAKTATEKNMVLDQ